MLPAYGFFIRHATGIELNDVEVSFLGGESRPAFFLHDVKGISLRRVNAQKSSNAAVFVLQQIEDFTSSDSRSLPDKKIVKTEKEVF